MVCLITFFSELCAADGEQEGRCSQVSLVLGGCLLSDCMVVQACVLSCPLPPYSPSSLLFGCRSEVAQELNLPFIQL